MHVTVVVLSLTCVGYAIDGDLDTSFGMGGTVVTDFAGTADVATALAIDGNGRTVVAGRTLDHRARFALARYNHDGTLDASFGFGGHVTTDFGSSAGAEGVAIDGGGRIVAAGWFQAPVRSSDGTLVGYNRDFALARYHPDGSLDTTFGPNGDGMVTSDLPGQQNDSLFDMVIDAAGRLVVVGAHGNSDIALARYSEDGILDSSFGDGGFVATSLADFSTGYAVTVDAGGRIVVAGTTYTAATNSWSAVVARYNGDGSLDGSFGSGGIVLSGGWIVYGVAIDSGGRIVVGGAAPGGFLVARYTAAGAPDTQFNGSGHVITDGGLGLYVASDLAIDASGRIIAVGSTGASDFALARYLENGTLDASFGWGGAVSTDFPDYADARAVALDAEGNMVVAGGSYDVDDASSDDFAVARYVAAPFAYTFSGFFAPVDNAPVFNAVRAGSAVPVKFSLNGDQGLDILAAGSPASQSIACDVAATLNTVEQTVTSGASGLAYDAVADQYVYVWKTNKAWANTCRQLIVTLRDGTSHVANFRFSK